MLVTTVSLSDAILFAQSRRLAFSLCACSAPPMRRAPGARGAAAGGGRGTGYGNRVSARHTRRSATLKHTPAQPPAPRFCTPPPSRACVLSFWLWSHAVTEKRRNGETNGAGPSGDNVARHRRHARGHWRGHCRHLLPREMSVPFSPHLCRSCSLFNLSTPPRQILPNPAAQGLTATKAAGDTLCCEMEMKVWMVVGCRSNWRRPRPLLACSLPCLAAGASRPGHRCAGCPPHKTLALDSSIRDTFYTHRRSTARTFWTLNCIDTRAVWGNSEQASRGDGAAEHGAGYR